MPNIVPLNNVQHKNLKIITRYSASFGNNVGCVVTFPTEFAQVQREYPILFQKHPGTGQYQSIVLLGITPDENLYVHHEQWHARYIPAVVTCNPFIIGFEDQTAQGGSEHEPIVYLDLDSPRISETEGVSIFREFGGDSAYLEKTTRDLHSLYQGMAVSELMFSLFEELNLIEPVKLEIQLNDGKLYRLQGNYTINPERLASLDGESLAKLNRAGVLECAFFVAASLNNVKTLIDLKNNRLAL